MVSSDGIHGITVVVEAAFLAGGEPLSARPGTVTGMPLNVFRSPATTAAVNLSSLTSLAAHASNRLPTATDRTDTKACVTIVRTDTADVSQVTPLDPDGFCDGIQSSMVVTWLNRRPVTLNYVAAGCATDGSPAALTGLVERLWVDACPADAQAVRTEIAADSGVPVLVTDDNDPASALVSMRNRLASVRAESETELVDALTDVNPNASLVVDGSLSRLTPSPLLMGVAKTHKARYLADESLVYTLAHGWRSPVFSFVHPSAHRAQGGTPAPVFSAYVRAHFIPDAPWDAGLVRVETFSEELIDTACATVLAYGQHATGGDNRWDRHLAPVAWCEKLLRARRPVAFTV